VFGLIYLHTTGEHYDFSCIPAGFMITGQDYHIGMCECTNSKTLKMKLNTAVAYTGCAAQPDQIFDVRSCVMESELKLCATHPNYPGAGGSVPPFKGEILSSTRLASGTYTCFAVEYTCIYGTCYPSGYYGTTGVIGGMCGNSGGSVKGISARQAMPPYTPPVKCCGFSKQTKLNQALLLMGSIGGIIGVITTCLAAVLRGRMKPPSSGVASTVTLEIGLLAWTWRLAGMDMAACRMEMEKEDLTDGQAELIQQRIAQLEAS
jgi:hypothetical protein